MSGDRVLLIYTENRLSPIDEEGRDLLNYFEDRALSIDDEDRTLEVWLP